MMRLTDVVVVVVFVIVTIVVVDVIKILVTRFRMERKRGKHEPDRPTTAYPVSFFIKFLRCANAPS